MEIMESYIESEEDRAEAGACVVQWLMCTLVNVRVSTEACHKHLTTSLPFVIGGGTAQATSLRHPDLSRGSIKQLHQKMQEYRNMRDEHDETLRCVQY